MAKLPALQFYPGDWKKDVGVQSLSFETRGVWFEMLLLMHDADDRGVLSLNGNPMSEEQIANSIGMDPERFSICLCKILTSGVATRREDGAILNRRMVRDEYIRTIRSAAGKQGGNPALLNQNPTTRVKQNPTPSSSSSVSSSSSELNTPQPPKGGRTAKPQADMGKLEIPDALDSEPFRVAFAGWLDWRRTEKRAAVTPRAAQTQLRKLAELGATDAIRAIEHSIANDWQGIFPADRKRTGGADDNPSRVRAAPGKYDNVRILKVGPYTGPRSSVGPDDHEADRQGAGGELG